MISLYVVWSVFLNVMGLTIQTLHTMVNQNHMFGIFGLYDLVLWRSKGLCTWYVDNNNILVLQESLIVSSSANTKLHKPKLPSGTSTLLIGRANTERLDFPQVINCICEHVSACVPLIKPSKVEYTIYFLLSFVR